jgi:hypothetical protein
MIVAATYQANPQTSDARHSIEKIDAKKAEGWRTPIPLTGAAGY